MCFVFALKKCFHGIVHIVLCLHNTLFILFTFCLHSWPLGQTAICFLENAIVFWIFVGWHIFKQFDFLVLIVFCRICIFFPIAWPLHDKFKLFLCCRTDYLSCWHSHFCWRKGCAHGIWLLNVVYGTFVLGLIGSWRPTAVSNTEQEGV